MRVWKSPNLQARNIRKISIVCSLCWVFMFCPFEMWEEEKYCSTFFFFYNHQDIYRWWFKLSRCQFSLSMTLFFFLISLLSNQLNLCWKKIQKFSNHVLRHINNVCMFWRKKQCLLTALDPLNAKTSRKNVYQNKIIGHAFPID